MSKIYQVKLKKIESTHNNVRSNEINGVCYELPKVGSSFMLLSSETLTPDTNLRQIVTSEITEVREFDGEIIFRTRNSLYSITVIDESSPYLM